MKQPKWTIDEVILGVNTYFEIGDVRKITIENPLLIELSNVLKEMPIHKEKDNTFRNLAGVRMTLFCIASLDQNAAYFMRGATNLQEQVFNYYLKNKLFLSKVASAIKRCLPLPFSYYEPVKKTQFIYGNVLFEYHKYIENKTKQAIYITNNLRDRLKSKCLACGVDLHERYGKFGVDLLEIHYNDSIVNCGNEMDILPGKFVPICPNCHSLAHSVPDLFLLDNLRNEILRGSINV